MKISSFYGLGGYIMKKVISKSLKRCLSFALVICLIVGICPAVFAAESEQKKYVSLGDSMTNGYGLTGYGNVNGYLEESPDAYPAKVSEHFGWELTQLAMSAMRAEDLHYILEYGKENAYQGDGYTKSEFINGRFVSDCGGVEAAADTYQNAVAQADVISLGVGNANFGVFLLGRITNALGVLGGNPSADAWIDFEDAIRECDEPTKAFLRQIREEVKASLYASVPEESHEIIAPIENAISYAVVSFAMSYAGCVDRIVELNPDAEIMIVGLMNTFSGMDLAYEGEIIPLDDIVGEVVEAVNIYLSTQPVVLQMLGKFPQAKFYYAESPNVDVIVNTFASQINNPDSVLRDRVLTEVQGMIWPMLNATAPGTYVNITRADVEEYEKAMNSTPTNVVAISKYLKENESKLMSVCVYLAFEKAIVEASQLDALDSEAIIKLLGGLSTVFDGIQEKVEAHMEDNIDTKKMGIAMSVAIYIRGSMDVTDIYKYIALPDGMSYVLEDDPTIMSLLNLFGRMLIGNGIGCHPSAAGHDDLTAAIIEAYENGQSAQDASSQKISVAIDKILYALEKYGPQDSNAYEVNDESYYVALGDSSALPYECIDYVEQFATENKLNYKNLAQKGLLIQDGGAILTENYEDIAKADLITIGFSNTTLLQKAMTSAFNPTEYDWSALVTEQGAVYIEGMLQSIKEELIAAGIQGQYTIGGFIKIDIAEFVLTMIEDYAYNALVYAYTMPEYVNAVRKINPDAKIVIVGMYNPLNDVTLELSETQLIPIGEYLDNVVDAATLHSTVYSLVTENVIFVEAPDVENANKDTSLNLLQFTVAVNSSFALYPNAEGHTYIKDQLTSALDITINKTRPVGDVNNDGIVNIFDATEIQRFSASLREFDEEEMVIADVNFDNKVNILDVTVIQRYVAGHIKEFTK